MRTEPKSPVKRFLLPNIWHLKMLFIATFCTFFLNTFAQEGLTINTEGILIPSDYGIKGPGLNQIASTGSEVTVFPEYGESDVIKITLIIMKPDSKERLMYLTVDNKSYTKGITFVDLGGHEQELSEDLYQAEPGYLAIYSTPQSKPSPAPYADFYIPLEEGLIFSPNGDDQYDYFYVESSIEIEDYLLKVHNLEGDLVFGSSKPQQKWNGNDMSTNKLVPQGNYTFTLVINEQTVEGQFLIEYK